jgi:hypothetical protein
VSDEWGSIIVYCFIAETYLDLPAIQFTERYFALGYLVGRQLWKEAHCSNIGNQVVFELIAAV